MNGVNNLIDDIQKGYITITDETAFEVGGNLAVTPGIVVFENELIQLIQYNPTTEAVDKTPILIVPPCINKFYIFDLTADNSFVRYLVDLGYSVFLISWRNPDDALGHISWDDYIELGVLQALDVVTDVAGYPKAHALGFFCRRDDTRLCRGRTRRAESGKVRQFDIAGHDAEFP